MPQETGSRAAPAQAARSGMAADDFSGANRVPGERAGALLDDMKEGAAALGGEARERVDRYATTQKDVVTEHLQDFAQAVRRASDDLSDRDQTMASQLVRQAANGLESLSRSVGGSTPEDMVNSVRSFGRSNPAAFIGGAVLAGLAIGRFARASAHSGGGRDAWDGGSFDRDTASRSARSTAGGTTDPTGTPPNPMTGGNL